MRTITKLRLQQANELKAVRNKSGEQLAACKNLMYELLQHAAAGRWHQNPRAAVWILRLAGLCQGASVPTLILPQLSLNIVH